MWLNSPNNSRPCFLFNHCLCSILLLPYLSSPLPRPILFSFLYHLLLISSPPYLPCLLSSPFSYFLSSSYSFHFQSSPPPSPPILSLHALMLISDLSSNYFYILLASTAPQILSISSSNSSCSCPLFLHMSFLLIISSSSLFSSSSFPCSSYHLLDFLVFYFYCLLSFLLILCIPLVSVLSLRPRAPLLFNLLLFLLLVYSSFYSFFFSLLLPLHFFRFFQLSSLSSFYFHFGEGRTRK